MSEPKKSGDAQETLGTILPGGSEVGRDAIHVAVLPAVATMPLSPGQHVGPMPDGSWLPSAPKKMGVVDPYLTAFVRTGQKFWVLLYPRTVTGLRHVWSHPELPEEKR